MIRTTVLYCPDGAVSSSIAPLEILYSAGSQWNLCVSAAPRPRFAITTASVDGLPVKGGAGIQVVPEKRLADIDETDLVIIPAGSVDIDALIAKNAAAIPWLVEMHRKGALLAGNCTGVALIAEAGLLDGRRATTFWPVSEMFRARYPKVDWQPQLQVTEDRGIFCCAGVYASVDLALYIVERLCGRDIALSSSKSLAVHMPRTYQRGFSVLPIGRDHPDAAIRRAEEWLHNHFPDDVDLDKLAVDHAFAPRTFTRRFKAATGETPLAYLQRLRTEAAKRMLEEDRMTVQEVGLAVGYEDVAFFRDVFKRYAGLAPGAYRERYGHATEPSAA